MIDDDTGEIPIADAVVVTSRCEENNADLPSSLTYKDLGRDLDSVLASPSHRPPPVLQTLPAGRDLPSNLSYKDQRRDLDSVLPPSSSPSTQKQTTEHDRVLPNQQNLTVNRNFPSSEPTSTNRCKATTLTFRWIACIFVVGVLAAAAVVVAMLLSDRAGGGGTEDYNKFDGTAHALVVLNNITTPIPNAQIRWFETVLEEFWEESLLAVDRPFQAGWSVMLQDQQVITYSLATKLAIRIPLDTNNDRTNFLTVGDVELLLRNVLNSYADNVQSRLQTTDSLSTRSFFAPLSGLAVFSVDTKPEDLDSQFQMQETSPLPTAFPVTDPGRTEPSLTATALPTTVSTTMTTAQPLPTNGTASHPSPSRRPTIQLTNRPTPRPQIIIPPAPIWGLPPFLFTVSPVPTAAPTAASFFSTREELRTAVIAYAEDPQNPSSTVAVQYGYPIGTWYVRYIKRVFPSQLCESTANGSLCIVQGMFRG